MKIYRDTKIAYLIKQNKDSIEAIAGVAKPFEKLRNPILRKMLAGRTSLEDAARMGGCDIEVLGAALKPLGFELVNERQKQQKGKGALTASQDFQDHLDSLPETALDVRSDLAKGEDPLKKIMAAVTALPTGHVLRLINTFEPTPLLALLANKGFESIVQRKGPDEVHTFFRQRPGAKQDNVSAADDEPVLTEAPEFEERVASFGDNVRNVDVRGMEMPQPMITILEALSDMDEKTALLVTHQRIPVFLFSELRERNFAYLLNKRGETDVRLLIFHGQQ